MTDTSLVKIQTSPKKSYYLLSKLKDGGKEGFRLKITDGERVWAGELTEDDLDQLSTEIKIDFETYVQQTRNALTQQASDDLSFEYQVKAQGNNSINFIWKKYVPGNDIRFQLGSASLDLKPNSTVLICEMFSHCVQNTGQLQSHVHDLETDNERLSQERSMALKRLDKCVTAKEEMEKDLYSKFVAVLNSKKEKIRSLKCKGTGDKIHPSDDEMVAETTHIDGDIADEISTNSRNKTRRESEEEGTDDEQVTFKKRPKQTKTVKKSDHDSSLVLEEDAEESVTRPVTRPARRAVGNRKQTPSKAVLPRVSSKSSSDSSSRRTSLRKSGSNLSTRSSNDIQPEDLFADL